jgi:hypothetical protein
MRQFVQVKFPRGGRLYTYHNDGDPVVPGDQVKIAGRGDDGWQAAHVDAISFTKPAFDTKPIMGRVDPAQPDLLAANEPDLFKVESMSHRCETCGVKDGHERGCVENISPEDEPDRVECGNCYGNGCSSCGMRGTVETVAGRERREEWEDGAYDRARDARIHGDD